MKIRFDIQGVSPGAKTEFQDFKTKWAEYTSHENRMMGNSRKVSTAQFFVMDLFCGLDEMYVGFPQDTGDSPEVWLTLSTISPPQVELEALFRARNRALAELFGASR